MPKRIIMNNVVTREKLRPIQSQTLQEIKSILEMSFGPNGSNTCIKMENGLPKYSKDGHTILGAIHYNGIIEQSIKDDLESITRNVVKNVGDGTTSAVLLSSLIFDRIHLHEDKYKPVEIVTAFNKIAEMIISSIKESAKPITIDDVYDIAMISTNGNSFIAETLKEIYNEHGFGVFIDVSAGLNEDFVVKTYNGMTLSTGYADSCYVTNTENNTCVIDHPEVYFFEHPIDTKELGVYFDSIISANIIHPLDAINKGDETAMMIPTVIFAPKISQDMTSLMDSLTSYMAKMPASNKLPICIISEYQDIENLNDLAMMCGAKLIRKYIDPKIYEYDKQAGRAPTPETICNWAGTCEQVVAHSDKTIFVRPSKVYDEYGEYSELYNNLVRFLESEIAKAKSGGDSIREVGHLKRRLNSLKSNMVELYVGGISQADRDSLRDLVEDAVLNIRSAAQYGVGFGANISGAIAVDNVFCESSFNADSLESEIIVDIDNAYTDLIDILYGNTSMFDGMRFDSPKMQAIIFAKEDGKVYNIREKCWATNVKTSIMSDIVVLESVTKIIGIMATCNQFIVPTAMHNVYENNDEN